MADTGNLFGDTVTKSVLIDSNLADKEYYLVSLDNTDDNIVNLAVAATTLPFALTEGKDGSSAVKVGTIAIGGRAKVKLADTVAPGGPIMANGSGLGIPATTGKYIAGYALKGGVSGDVIEFLVQPGYWGTVS